MNPTLRDQLLAQVDTLFALIMDIEEISDSVTDWEIQRDLQEKKAEIYNKMLLLHNMIYYT